MASHRRTVEGVIVRQMTTGVERQYIVVWSKEFNHSFLYPEDVDPVEWIDAYPCEWKQFDVEIAGVVDGPDGIETHAFNLRKTFNSRADPTTRADQCYNDVHTPRSVNVFSTVEGRKTIKFKDNFEVPPRSGAISLKGKFIENAYINLGDLREMQKFGIKEFEAVVELERVAKLMEKQPWRITQFVFEGKELSLHGWLSRQGHLRHGPGGVLCAQALVPPDTLRLRQVNAPSRFAATANDAPPPPAPAEVLPFGAADEAEAPRSLSTMADSGIADVANQSLVPQEQSPWEEAASQPPQQICVPTVAAAPPVSIETMGIVLHKDGDWFLYSPVMTAPTRVYIRFQGAFPLEIGRWYSFKYKGTDANINHTLDFNHVDALHEIACPQGVGVRVFPCEEQPENADVVMIVYADFDNDGQDFGAQCRQLGWLSLPEDNAECADFSKIHRAIVEVTAFPNGLVVRRAHNSNLNPQHLLDPLVPYNVFTGNDAHPYLASVPLFTLPRDCDEEWKFHKTPSTPEYFEENDVHYEVQPSDNISREVVPVAEGHEFQALPSDNASGLEYQLNNMAIEDSEIRPDEQNGNYSAPVPQSAAEENDSTKVDNVMAIIEEFHSTHLVVFCPLDGYNRIYVPYDSMRDSPYMKEGHPVGQGYWMQLGVYALDGSHGFSHQASNKPDDLPQWAVIGDLVSGWNQRCLDGIIQFQLSLNFLSPTWKVDEFHDKGDLFYLCHTDQQINVRIPASRLAGVLGPSGMCKLRVQFWASRGDSVCNNCLFLRKEDVMVQLEGDDTPSPQPNQLPEQATPKLAPDDAVLAAEEASRTVESPEPPVNEPQPEISLEDIIAALYYFENATVWEAVLAEGMAHELSYLIRLRESIGCGDTNMSALDFSRH